MEHEGQIDERFVIEKPSVLLALLPIAVTLVILMVQIFVYEGAPHIPLALGILITAVLSLMRGYSWTFMQEAMTEVVATAIPVFGVLLTIGMIIGTWILCGTVPLLIDYGLAILSPGIFLPAACIICSFISLATGTSWGTAGTVGLALMGIGEGLGVPMYLTAGAVVSGAFFGDKMSPLSDTTNFAPAVCGTDLYSHIRNMLPSTVPAMTIAIILYAWLGRRYADNALEGETLVLITETLNQNFTLNVLLLVPPIVVLACAIMRVAALPGLFLGVMAAAVIAVLVQGATPGEVMAAMMDGYKSATGVEYVDNLLSKGGMMSMAWVTLLMLIALAYSGLLEKTRCLEAILEGILKRVHGRARLVTATVLSSLGFSITSDIYVALTVPGRLFSPAFRGLGLSTTNVSRIIEDGGTLAAPLIPWNSGGVFVAGALGVPTLLYAPFAFANWLSPLFDLLWGWTGFFVPKATSEEQEQWRLNDEDVIIDGKLAKASSQQPAAA